MASATGRLGTAYTEPGILPAMKRLLPTFLIVAHFTLISLAEDRDTVTKAESEKSGIEFFESTIRPLLVDHCYECHSLETKQEGGLAVDSQYGLLTGGDRGTSLDPGDAAKSLLIEAVRQTDDLAMPPDYKLADVQIAALEKWVTMGAPDPRMQRPAVEKFEQAAKHWAFQSLVDPTLPYTVNESWPQNDVDRYILAKLEAAGLDPSSPADPATLIRRVTIGLTGLPPKPNDVAAFCQDPSPAAYESLIDRLLESPQYGERWGRHWLDLARYADSSGFHNDLDRPYAWKYRDYVIRSFNEDKPYSQFVAEQLAGDEVPWADETTLIATGFCRNGPSNDDNMGKTAEAIKQYRADQMDDVISTTSTVFLGVTVGCARCHDHKTDPFTAKDYYGLIAIFNGTEPFGTMPGQKAKSKEKEVVDPLTKMHALVEKKSQVPVAYVMRRGIAANRGEEVGPAVPAVLVSKSLSFPEPDPQAKSSLRRLTLAQWITSPNNPLAWRVLANRVWQYHFGKGIVSTPSNFGFTGATPTHPELLDYLATQLIKNEGRLKPLHKQLLMSATYQQSSQTTQTSAIGNQIDPANHLLWKMNLRRMEAEVVRDSILAASGKLNLEMGGPGIKPRLRADLIPASQRNKWPAVKQEDAKHWRRSVYIYSKRQLLMPIMELFDAPTTTDSCAVRTESVVPTQALVLMNDEFVEEQASYLARRVLSEVGDDDAKAIERLALLTLAHPLDPKKTSDAEQFLRARRAQSDRVSALTDLAHVLFNSSEFIHIQ
jgi:hypothetical protein